MRKILIGGQGAISVYVEPARIFMQIIEEKKGDKMNIQELLRLPDKAMIVQPVVAKVTQVDVRRVGEGQYGQWSVQNLLLEDITGKIRCACWGRVDLTPLKDQTVLIGAKKGEKGWSGCSVKDNTFTATKGPNTGKQQTVKQLDLQDGGYLEITGHAPAAPAPPAPGVAIPPSSPENYGKTADMLLRGAAKAPQTALPGALAFWDYIQAVEVAHRQMKLLEPDDGVARAALVNTLMIAMSGGKVGLPEFEAGAPPEAGREPGQDDDPFKE